VHEGQVTLADGRMLAYTDIGDPDGAPVVHWHGTPSSRLELCSFDTAFANVGLRIITPDRPGYGRSSAQPGRSLRHCAFDAAALADATGIDRFVVTGLSGGGPFAMACCALIPERAVAACIAAGDPDLAWPGARRGYDPLELAIVDAPDVDAAVTHCAEVIGADGSGFLTSDALQWAEPDLAMFGDETFVAHAQATIAEGFRHGIAGYVHDVRVKGQPWPLDPSEIAVPIMIIHGDLDTIVPLHHSRMAAERIAGATLRVLPGHGHISIVPEWPPILAAFVRRVI
jgi:pimeloyl-ACP methyl ester carboxylesterase